MPLSKRSTSESSGAMRRNAEAEEGSAALEFLTAGLLLLVPLVYLTVTLAAVQGGALAVEGAARQAARVFVQAASAEEAADRAARAIDFALADHSIPADAASVTVSCSGTSGGCPSRNAVVSITVKVTVALPLIPDVFDLSRSASIPVQATARQQVSRFWAAQ